MLRLAVLVAVFLLLVKPVTSSTQCSSVISDKCIQKCNGSSCECNGREGDSVYTGCTQMCGLYPCIKITCSTENCIQSCHGCHMECARGVGFCTQRCLSGKCSFTCAARRCQQDCSAGDCRLIKREYSESPFPKKYLLLLAGCFAVTTLLSLIALCLSCRAMKQRRKNAYQRLRSINTTPPPSRGSRNYPAIRHGSFEFRDHHAGSLRPEAIRISVLPMLENPL